MRNLNQKMSDEDIEALLQLAASQVNDNKTEVEEEKKHIEQKRKAEEEKKRIEQRRKAEEEKKRIEEKRKAEEEKKRIEQNRKAEEEKKRIEERRKAEEEKKHIEEKRKAEEEKKRTEEKRKAEEEKKRQDKTSKADDKKQPEEPQKQDGKNAFDDLEQDVFVTKMPEIPEEEYADPWTVGRITGTFMEFVWTMIKLAVIVLVVTVVSGVLLSRDLMIRGRNGSRQCLEGMTVSANVADNKERENMSVDRFLERNKREKISMETDDGKIMVARQIINKKDSNRWAVILHGYGETMEDVYDIAMHYSEEGYNVLIPDLRAHGESEGAIYGMGWLDRLDIINWMDVILAENPSAQIVIHGVDMGADTALMITGEPLKNNIKAVVAEGAYPDAWSVVKKEYKTRHEKLPVFPFLTMLNPVLKVWGGYSLHEADAVNQVKKSNVPTLLIRGANDTYVDENMMDELEIAVASTHETLEIVNGSHGDCRYADPTAYYDNTFKFVNTYAK